MKRHRTCEKIFTCYISSSFFFASVSHIQRKWKGIRTCYARELQKKKRERNESAASGRKQYVYFESLRFLETVAKQPAVSTEEGLATNFSLDNDNEEDQEVGQEVQKEDWEPEKRIHRQSRKRTSAENDEPRTNNGDDAFIHVFKKILQAAEKSSCEKDEDRFFLLSLVSELHKVPPNKKLKLKSEIINAIFQAQQT